MMIAYFMAIGEDTLESAIVLANVRWRDPQQSLIHKSPPVQLGSHTSTLAQEGTMLVRSAALAVLLASSLSLAAPPEWKPVSLEVRRFDAMNEPKGERFRGELVTYETRVTPADGQTLVELALTVEIDWQPTSEGLNVPAADTVLTGDGQPGKLIGVAGGQGVVIRRAVALSWPRDPMLKAAKKQPLRLVWIGEVPKAAKQVKLKLGDKEATADLPAQPAKVDPAEWIDFGLGKTEAAVSYLTATARPGNTLMKLSLTLTPKKPSYKDDAGKEWFAFDTSSLNVRADDKVYPVIGYVINDNITKPSSYSVGIPYSNQSRLPMSPIFEVPVNTTKATVLWCGWPVAEVKVGS
jgi:hypothetical protein